MTPRQITRRTALATLAVVAASRPAAAQTGYPSRAVTILVPFGPGGTTDIIARFLAEHFRHAFHGQFIVENKPGASGTIAMAQLARSAPDGHTLIANEITQTVYRALYARLAFDPIADVQPISLVAETPVLLGVSKDLPVSSLKELIAYGKANPGKLNFGSGGLGSGPHIAGELLKRVGGLQMTHVAYRGSGAALNDLLSGQIQVLCSAAPTLAPHVASGAIRALAVAGPKRVPLLPDTPTAAEAALPDFAFSIWFGLAGPKGLPDPLIERLHAEVLAMLAKPGTRDRLVAAGADPVGLGPKPFAERIATETVTWSALMRESGLVPE